MNNRQLNLADMDCVHYILDDVLGMNLMKLFVEARETSRQFWTSQTVQKYVRQVQRSFLEESDWVYTNIVFGFELKSRNLVRRW